MLTMNTLSVFNKSTKIGYDFTIIGEVDHKVSSYKKTFSIFSQQRNITMDIINCWTAANKRLPKFFGLNGVQLCYKTGIYSKEYKNKVFDDLINNYLDVVNKSVGV